MTDGTYEITDKQTLHVWTNGEYGRWWCIAYDHGPFCRRCKPLDETTEALLENVLDGRMEMKDDDPDRGLIFRLTEVGIRGVRQMLKGDEDV
jgi:hypothetical protein